MLGENKKLTVWKAAAQGLLSELRDMVESGVEVNALENGDVTPLHEAARNGQFPVAEWLLNAGANVNARTLPVRDEREGCCPLHEAAMSGHTSIVRLLLDHQAKINAKTSDGFTPLMCAVERDHTEVVELLISRGANVNLKGQHGTALHIASSNVEIARLLLVNGADMRCRNAFLHETPLMVAAYGKSLDVVRLLLDAGAEPNDTDRSGETALHGAVLAWSVREYDSDNRAPRGTCASLNNCLPLVKLLLERGANPAIKGESGFTALDYARRIGARELTVTLEQFQTTSPTHSAPANR